MKRETAKWKRCPGGAERFHRSRTTLQGPPLASAPHDRAEPARARLIRLRKAQEPIAQIPDRQPDELDVRVFDLMRELWIQGLDDPQLRIARAVAYLPAWRFLLMTKAAGRTLYDWLLDEPRALERPRLTADWLRRLHGVHDDLMRLRGRYVELLER